MRETAIDINLGGAHLVEEDLLAAFADAIRGGYKLITLRNVGEYRRTYTFRPVSVGLTENMVLINPTELIP
jgi:hypothetical protein